MVQKCKQSNIDLKVEVETTKWVLDMSIDWRTSLPEPSFAELFIWLSNQCTVRFYTFQAVEHFQVLALITVLPLTLVTLSDKKFLLLLDMDYSKQGSTAHLILYYWKYWELKGLVDQTFLTVLENESVFKVSITASRKLNDPVWSIWSRCYISMPPENIGRPYGFLIFSVGKEIKNYK